MKLKISCIAILMALALFSCSDEDNGTGKKEIVYNATLSLGVKNEIATKADDLSKAPNSSAYIKKLTIAVFQSDVLVALKDTTAADDNGVYSIEEVKVPAGVVKAFVFANLPSTVTSGWATGTTLLSDIQKNGVLDLSNEMNGSLAMTSDELDYTLRAGYNYVGYTTTPGAAAVDLTKGIKVAGYELTGAVVPVTRYISRVQLTKITLAPSDLYSKDITAASFELDTLFFASVKDKCMLLASGTTDQKYESANADFWSGAFATISGSLKASTAGTVKDFLCYNFTKAQSISEIQSKYSFDNKFFYTDSRTPDQKITLTWPNGTTYKDSPDDVLGSYAYVYENSSTTDPTLLVVKGKYSYTIKGGATVTMSDRFYTVKVNDKDDATRNFESGTTKHDFIVRNNIYKIALTIAGPGSDKPYDPTPSAAINAKVTVEKWKVVNMTPDVD